MKRTSKQLRETLKENVEEANVFVKHVLFGSIHVLPQIKDQDINFKDLELSLDKAIWHAERARWILRLLEEATKK